MQAKAGQVHVSRSDSRGEAGEDVAQLFRMLAAHAPCIILLIKLPKAFMADGQNHCITVTRNVTQVRAIRSISRPTFNRGTTPASKSSFDVPGFYRRGSAR